jgi:hypothetical protein
VRLVAKAAEGQQLAQGQSSGENGLCFRETVVQRIRTRATREPTGGVRKMVGDAVGRSDGVVWRQQGGGGAVARTWARESVCRVGSGPGGKWPQVVSILGWAYTVPRGLTLLNLFNYSKIFPISRLRPHGNC